MTQRARGMSVALRGTLSEASLEGGLPYLFSLQAVMGGLQLLDALSVVYYPMIRGRIDVVRFELGVSLVPTLVLAFVLWVGWFASRKEFKVLVFPAVALVFNLFIGLGDVVSAANLVAGWLVSGCMVAWAGSLRVSSLS